MNLNKCLLSFVTTLDSLKSRSLGEITNVEYCVCGYKKGNTPPSEGWMPYDSNILLEGLDGHYWLRASFVTPAVSDREDLVLKVLTGLEGKGDALNPQGLIYLNGKMVQGLDTNHSEVYLEPETEYELYNYFYVGMIDQAVNCRFVLQAIDRLVETVYYDMKVPFDVCQFLPEDSDAVIRMTSVLVDATRIADLRDPGSEAYYASLEATKKFLDEEFYGKLCSTEGKPVVWCVGHTHIDVEWLWTRHQTREKVQRSFATAKSLMDRYPEYKFMLSQPELYRYLKEEAPEKYEELKQLVKEGRWEPEGSMYLEADCNLTSGESLIRQILHGKKFFREEFGVENKVLFLPDVFGYSAAMPQILKKSGVDYFVTSKISWNDVNQMPKDVFLWEGIDGTEIFTSFITTQPFGGMPGKRTQRTTYVGHLTPTEIKGSWDRFGQKEYCNQVLTTYGFGDGGGGPTKEMLETQRRLAYGLPGMPVTKMGFLLPHLEEMKRQFDASCQRTGRPLRWVGELYLEYHRGTYTSMAKNKQGNRRSEQSLGTAEALSATDLYFGGCYDSEGLNKIWRRVLHNQFHDILPGSSIGKVYDLTEVDYQEILGYGDAVGEEKRRALASRVSTDGGTFVYNPTGFARKGAVEIRGTYCESDTIIPAFGWAVLKDSASESRVKVKGLTAENDFYVLTLNEAGQIVSLLDKRVGREVFKAGEKGNVLAVFEDHPTKYDAWEIEDYYKLKKWTLDDAAEITAIRDGSRGGFRIRRRYMKSEITQTLWLYSENSRIDFVTDLDWHETHQILKAVFPLNVHATSATYDVQFGHVVRPTHMNTSWDEAKFETYAHKWVDLSENGYGVALLNDSKYGHSTEGSDLSITLLKCPTYPNPNADQGKHHFTYALMPHVGDFREAGVIAEAWALNQPQMGCPIGAQRGELPETFSFVSCDAPNAVITAVKKAEADDGLIVRLYDAFDCKSKVTVRVPEGYKTVALCDMMENPEKKLILTDGAVTLPLSNFEIVTLKFTK